MAIDPNTGGAGAPHPYLELQDPYAAPPAPSPAPEPEVMVAPVPEVMAAPKRTRGSRAWIGMVAIGCVGAIAAGTLGFFLYVRTGERDDARQGVDATLASLTSTQAALTSTQQDLVARKGVAAYTAMYVADSGKVGIDYQKLTACTSFGSCRTAAQSLLFDLQLFQSDRSSALVPPGLANSDAMLRDALSAAIAADQALISGMDNGNQARFKDGWKKLTAAMLSVAKAEAVLGEELK